MKLLDHLYLVEAMTYTTLLTEASRFEFLMKTYGSKIEAKWEQEKANEPGDIVATVTNMARNAEGQENANAMAILNLIMDYDPTPAKKNSNWLANIYCKGGLKLEDLPRAPDYISRYDAMKKARQIAPEHANIERFKSLNDLYDVVKDATQTQQVATSTEEQQMRAQATVLYDEADYLVVAPKTQEAAGYFGRDTEWCTTWGCANGRHPTRTSQYPYYSSRGQLWIIIDKATGGKWQLHFENGEFRDVDDRMINFKTFFNEHPKLIQILGEKNFVKWVRDIGLSHFSPETLAGVSQDVLTNAVNNLADFERVPEEMQQNPHFIVTLITRKEALKWLPVRYYKDMLDELLDLSASLIFQLPKRYLTQERVNTAFGQLGKVHWQRIEDIPEEFWTEEIRLMYWHSKADDTHQNLHFKDIPEQYTTPEMMLSLLKRYPVDILDYAHELDAHMAAKIGNRDFNVMRYLPVQFLTEAMAEQLVREITNAYDDKRRKELSTTLDRFPKDTWSTTVAEHYITSRALPFAELPERFRTNHVLMKKLLHRNNFKDVPKVPGSYLTPALIRDVIANGHQEGLRALLKAHRELVTPDVLAAAIGACNIPQFILPAVPKALMTIDVMRAFAVAGKMPLQDLPHELLTDSIILRRAREEPEELKVVPDHLWTDKLAVEVVTQKRKAAQFIPPHALTEPVMHRFLETERHSHNYRHGSDGDEMKAIFKRFPKTSMSPRNYALAVDGHFLEPHAKKVPKGMMNAGIAAEVLIKDPKQIKHLPPELANDPEILAAAVARRVHLLDVLSPEQITEPVAYAAIKQYAHYVDWQNIRHFDKELAKIPRAVWSARVWQEAVGHLVRLKEVPEDYVSPELVRVAIMRDPKNLRDLPNAAAYLRQHNVDLSGVSKHLRSDLENNGLLLTKKGPQDLNDLPKEPLQGGSCAVVMKGSVNKSVYIFDENDVLVGRVYTEKDKVKLPMKKAAAEPYRALFQQAAKKFLASFDLHELNKIGIYGTKWKEAHGEDDLEKKRMGALAWSQLDHLDVTRHTAYLGDTKILRVDKGVGRGGWGNSGNAQLGNVKVLDMAACIEHSQDIIKYFKKHSFPEAYAYTVRTIGLTAPKNGDWTSMVQQKLGSGGKLSVWTGDKYVCVVGPKGVMAQGVKLVNGTITKIQVHYEYSKMEDKLTALLKKFEKISVKPKKPKKVVAPPAAPPDLPALREELFQLALAFRPDMDQEAIRAQIGNYDLEALQRNKAALQRRLRDAGNGE